MMVCNTRGFNSVQLLTGASELDGAMKIKQRNEINASVQGAIGVARADTLKREEPILGPSVACDQWAVRITLAFQQPAHQAGVAASAWLGAGAWQECASPVKCKKRLNQEDQTLFTVF